MLQRLTNYVVLIVTDATGATRGRARLFKAFLLALSKVYKFVVSLRGFLYRARLKKPVNLGCVVISVGNITVGGTGKTPVVEMLAEKLRAESRRVAILTRGYKSRSERRLRDLFSAKGWKKHPPFKIVSTGDKPLLDARTAGDEAFMLAQNLRGVSVLSGKNRVQSAAYAVETLGADTLLLDDGFQYRRLGRTLDIVLIDAVNPFGNEHLLPRGVLREPLKSLQRAHCFFLTKANRTHTSGLVRILKEINPEGLIVECAHSSEYVFDISSNTRKNLDFLKGKNVFVFSAIASPEGFEDSVRDLGAVIAGTERFVDHHPFSLRELRLLTKTAVRLGAKFILTTEKDAVRIPRAFKSPLPICFLRVKIEIIRGAEQFHDLLSRVCFY